MTLPLLPYQHAGAQWLAPRIRAGCFDEAGLGKSAQTIQALDLRGADRNIIVCPAAARDNWLGEFRKFSSRRRRIIKGRDIHDFVAWQKGRFDTLVTSYEKMSDWAKHVTDANEVLDAVVLDEGHYLKNSSSGRTKKILGPQYTGEDGPIMWAKASYWLTATPDPNDPGDNYTFLRFCEVMPLSERNFLDRYFKSRKKTYSESHTINPANLRELQALLVNNAIKRTFEQVGYELPPLWTQTYLVDGDTQAVRDLLLQHPGLDAQIVEHLQDGLPLSSLTADFVATLRRLIGEAKALPYAQLLRGDLESGVDKMVCMGVHRYALETVHQYLTMHGIKSALLYGATPENQRKSIIDAFQNDPTFRVLIGNIRTAGTALTFTASSRIDMLESDWAPGINWQALKRIHRLGQLRKCTARFISLANSFDEQVEEIIAAKTAALASVHQGT